MTGGVSKTGNLLHDQVLNVVQSSNDESGVDIRKDFKHLGRTYTLSRPNYIIRFISLPFI